MAWRYLAADGSERGRSEGFPDRQAAEDWLAAEWAGLAERGIEEVELVEQPSSETLYRMSLGPA
jgi:hypothetical protein